MKKSALFALALSAFLAPSALVAQTVLPLDFFGPLSNILQQVDAAQKQAAKKRKQEEASSKPLREYQEALEKLHEKVAPAVLQIETETGSGTGFIIDVSGLMLTANHVADTDEVIVKSDHVAPIKAKVIARAPERDIAILQIEGDRKDWPVLVLGDSAKVKPAHLVYSFGNALHFGVVPKDGLVQRCDSDEFNPYASCVQTSAGIDHGDSGGPLVNIRGEVIGMNLYKHPESRNMSFSVKSDVLGQTLKEYRKDGELADYGIEAIYQLYLDPGKGIQLKILAAPNGSMLRQSDVIEAIDGVALSNDGSAFEVFKKKIAKKGKDGKATLKILHQDPQPDGTVKESHEEIEVPMTKLSGRQEIFSFDPHGLFQFPNN